MKSAREPGQTNAEEKELSMDKLTKDAERMLEVMERTVNRADIWQDRLIYWMAVAIYHLICEVKKSKPSRPKGVSR